MQFIDLATQYQHLQKKIDARIKSVLNHGQYIMGPEVQDFESKLAEYVGVKHAITCANGTDALSLAMMTLDVKAKDAIFCPTFTFFASAETIAYQGATPIFVDSDEHTFNICPVNLEEQIQKALSETDLRPKAILAVDLFGLPANYPELKQIASKYNLAIIEDAAQGFGGDIKGRKAGVFGDISTTSFFPAKPLGCYGDGGAVFTDNDEYAELLKSFRVHGKGKHKYDNVRVGLNSRLDTIQAAILLEKIEVFPEELKRRDEIANNYTSCLKKQFRVPLKPEGYFSSWAQYTIVDDKRDFFIKKLKSAGIPSMIYYYKCMHQQDALKHYKLDGQNFPIAEKLANSVFSLPFHPYMKEEQIQIVVRNLTS